MNERERLLKLLKQADDKCKATKQCENCVGFGKGADCVDFLLTDYLLDSGVIVPPCKVGDTVYRIKTNGKIAEGIVESIHQNRIGCTRGRWIVTAWFDNYYAQTKTAGFECGTHLYLTFDDFGKTVFLTKEEAEKALAEREQK